MREVIGQTSKSRIAFAIGMIALSSLFVVCGIVMLIFSGSEGEGIGFIFFVLIFPFFVVYWMVVLVRVATLPKDRIILEDRTLSIYKTKQDVITLAISEISDIRLDHGMGWRWYWRSESGTLWLTTAGTEHEIRHIENLEEVKSTLLSLMLQTKAS